MADSGEMFMDLEAAAAWIHKMSGREVTATTVRRWRREGVDGCRLRCTLIGAVWVTSEEWLLDFFDDCAKAKARAEGDRPEGEPVESPPPLSAEAQRMADKYGIGQGKK